MREEIRLTARWTELKKVKHTHSVCKTAPGLKTVI